MLNGGLPPWLYEVQPLVAAGTLSLPGSELYASETKTWAAQNFLHPQCLARPRSTADLSHLLKYLHDSELDYAVRSGGIGDASARDILISMSAFDSFAFDPVSETITIGAGQTWSDVDRRMETCAPGYIVLSARCSFVGVGGSVVHGGISWASSEFGLASDPQNMLDALVVKANGDILWASEEPDLLWSLRGGGGGFAVVVALKLRVHKYPNKVFAGTIHFPNTSLPQLAKEVAAFTDRTTDPKMAMHVFCLDTAHAALTGQTPQPGIMALVYDANGEEHARSADGFGWAFNIQDAVDHTGTMTFKELNALQDSLKAAFGQTNTWMSAVTIPHCTEALILRTWDWFNNALAKDPKFAAGTFSVIEILQPPAFSSLADPSTAAWPHTSNRHILQLGVGAPPGFPDSDALAVKVLEEGAYEISRTHTAADYAPNFTQAFNDIKALYGANYGKLKKLKEVYDPKNRLGGPFA